MRSETEIFDLIMKVAHDDDRIRVVGLNGSRANAGVIPDRYQDFDIAYLVTGMDWFLRNPEWVDVFGKRIIMQTPESMSLYPPTLGGWFTYLMLFEDGSRIDLMLVPVEDADKYLHGDSLVRILMDKDRRIRDIPDASDELYRVRKPSPEEFDDCCNEFWWVGTYVAKGLCREELLYSVEMLNDIVRKQLLQMYAWNAGIISDYTANTGKAFKFLNHYLDELEEEALMRTYVLDTLEHAREAFQLMMELFRDASLRVATALNYTYPDYDHKVTPYINKLWEESVS